jgi:hypothetical protein
LVLAIFVGRKTGGERRGGASADGGF